MRETELTMHVCMVHIIVATQGSVLPSNTYLALVSWVVYPVPWQLTYLVAVQRSTYLWQRNPAGACFELTIPISLPGICLLTSSDQIVSLFPPKVSVKCEA